MGREEALIGSCWASHCKLWFCVLGQQQSQPHGGTLVLLLPESEVGGGVWVCGVEESTG